MSVESAYEWTRRELIEELLSRIEMEIWDMSAGDIENLAEFLGLPVEYISSGIFQEKNLDD